MGTVGRWEVSPNAVNSVPREAALEVDVRDVDADRRDGVVAEVLAEAARIAEARRVRLETRVVSQDPPAASGEAPLAALAAAVEHLGLTSRRMVSRAYHDSLFMAQVGRGVGGKGRLCLSAKSEGAPGTGRALCGCHRGERRGRRSYQCTLIWGLASRCHTWYA